MSVNFDIRNDMNAVLLVSIVTIYTFVTSSGILNIYHGKGWLWLLLYNGIRKGIECCYTVLHEVGGMSKI